MADQWRRPGPPPLYSIPEVQTGGEMKSSAFLETDGLQHDKNLSLPLPDYETLYSQKRHGVQGQTRWDHLIAEVNQRHRELPPELMGPEMSVDGPVDRNVSPTSSIPEERSALGFYKTHSSDNKPVSTKKTPAPAPPEPGRSPFPEPGSSPISPNPSAVFEKTDTRRAVSPSLAPAPPPRPSSQTSPETSASVNQKYAGVAVNKDTPTAKPRQKVSGPGPTQDSPVVSNSQTLPSLSESRTNKMDSFVEFDPFSNNDLLSKDPWATPRDGQKVTGGLTGNVQTEQKPEDRGMTPDDLDKIFNQDKPTHSLASFNGGDSVKNSPSSLKEDVSKQFSAAFQRKNSQKARRSFTNLTHSDKTSTTQQEPADRDGATSPTANQDSFTGTSDTLQAQADEKTQSNSYGGVDLFGAPLLTVPSALTASEEFASQDESLSGEKSHLRAWGSPSEFQAVNSQNSNGSGLVLSARRPHPVKPLSSAESQHPFSAPAGRDIKVRDVAAGRIKVGDSVDTGPYTQLTQEELITLVVKQQTDLSIRDAKIAELEEYIDNLLVRVIEEKPTILQALKIPKPM